jgi:D-alanyl-D-alanine carboxypeptidase
MRNTILLFILLTLPFTALQAATSSFDEKVQKALSSHYSTYKDKEYFSGIALAIYKPKEEIKDYYIGQSDHDKDSKPLDKDSLFEIGSITKSFTAALVLQLEKENLLSLDDTLARHLSDYSKWSSLTLRKLLNMTSGLPNYSDSPLMNTAEFKDIGRLWTNQELIHFSYPEGTFSPPLKTGYFYSNTGYILTAMIIERLSHQSFQTELERRLIKPAALQNTFYAAPKLNAAYYNRLVHGYSYNPYLNPELVGKDMKASNLSWAGAAGALVSNPRDVIQWVKALFVENKILDKHQKDELTQLISTTTGKAIKSTSSADPRGFGLGVVQGYDKTLGQYWFYEGQTEGFRALYFYSPHSGIIISSIFNSSVDGDNDHAGELMKLIYKLTLADLKKRN